MTIPPALLPHYANALVFALRDSRNWTPVYAMGRVAELVSYNQFGTPGYTAIAYWVLRVDVGEDACMSPVKLKDGHAVYPSPARITLTNRRYREARRRLADDGLACDTCAVMPEPKRASVCSDEDDLGPCVFKGLLRRPGAVFKRAGVGFAPQDKLGYRAAHGRAAMTLLEHAQMLELEIALDTQTS